MLYLHTQHISHCTGYEAKKAKKSLILGRMDFISYSTPKRVLIALLHLHIRDGAGLGRTQTHGFVVN